MPAESLSLDADELVALTGYSQPGKQLAELKRRGFYRAHRARDTGRVILTRAHFEAVEAGERPKATPKLHLARA